VGETNKVGGSAQGEAKRGNARRKAAVYCHLGSQEKGCLGLVWEGKEDGERREKAEVRKKQKKGTGIPKSIGKGTCWWRRREMVVGSVKVGEERFYRGRAWGRAQRPKLLGQKSKVERIVLCA